MLPTTREVIKHFLSCKGCLKNVSNRNGILKTTKNLIHVSKKASMPIISERSIEKKLERLVKKDSNLKARKGRKVDNLNSLVNICQCKIIDKCSCLRQNKVPERQKGFWQIKEWNN